MTSRGTRVDLAELIALRLRARELAVGVHRRAHEPRSGGLHSPFRGRGMEYAESRPYASGDDVRHVDWRVTARSGQLHSKLFHPERDRVSAVLMDATPAMAFGTRACFKSVQAARIAALFAWFAQAQGDRLAAAAFGCDHRDMPITGGRRGVLRLLEHLVKWQPDLARDGAGPDRPLAKGGLNDALARLDRVLRPGSHLLMLLDTHQVDSESCRRLRGMSAHHDVIAMLLVDHLECDVLPPGRYPISDGQRRAWVEIATPRAATALRDHFTAQRHAVLHELRRSGVRAHELRTDADPVLALRDLLRGVLQSEVAA